jgi:hypothetical protein
MAYPKDKFSAGEQALGYLYQVRFALLQMLKLPEQAACFIEKDDDLDFSDTDEGKLLASLKHKAPGDRLTDLCPDFWKSVRIWLNRFKDIRLPRLTCAPYMPFRSVSDLKPTRTKYPSDVRPDVNSSSRAADRKNRANTTFFCALLYTSI